MTGGGSGLGRNLCQKLAQRGATVVTWDINAVGNKETAQLIKVRTRKTVTAVAYSGGRGYRG